MSRVNYELTQYNHTILHLDNKFSEYLCNGKHRKFVARICVFSDANFLVHVIALCVSSI